MKSMTGYGSSKLKKDGTTCRVEIKSLNSRFLELKIRAPHYLNPLESKIKALVESYITRGKVEVWIDLDLAGSGFEVRVSRDLVLAYHQASQEVAKITKNLTPLGAGDLFAIEGLIKLKHKTDPAKLWKLLMPCLEQGLKRLNELRIHDGKSVKKDILKKLRAIQKNSGQIAKRVKRLTPDYASELTKRLNSMLGKEFDQKLVLTEAALIASRADINEELARLTSHCELFKQELLSGEAGGKTLDFIAQEMNREINTIGSKQGDSLVSRSVINMKAMLEMIREQVRNLE